MPVVPPLAPPVRLAPAAAADLAGISPRSRPGAPGARPTPSRPSRRGWAGAGRQPRTSPARAAEATRTGGSPARRGPISCGIARPTTRSAAASTSRLLNPPPLPRLQMTAPRRCARRRGPWPRSPAGARRRGRRRGCSRGRRCRRASGSRRRTRSRGRPASTAPRIAGMRCVSGSWSSPSASVAPATLK